MALRPICQRHRAGYARLDEHVGQLPALHHGVACDLLFLRGERDAVTCLFCRGNSAVSKDLHGACPVSALKHRHKIPMSQSKTKGKASILGKRSKWLGVICLSANRWSGAVSL